MYPVGSAVAFGVGVAVGVGVGVAVGVGVTVGAEEVVGIGGLWRSGDIQLGALLTHRGSAERYTRC